MFTQTQTGILLHPTSLPGPWGIGTLGSEAEQFVRWVADSGAGVWQVLPLSPPVYSASPYQASSSFALNPLLLSPEKLAISGLLSKKETETASIPFAGRVDWKALQSRHALLETAAERALAAVPGDFSRFSRQRWVREWSVFAAKKEMNGNRPWHLWNILSPPPDCRVMIHAMLQFLLQNQWTGLKEYSRSIGVSILGDIPIYAAQDSSDAYFNREIFKLLPSGEPEFVAGVPPDYFSSSGQRWGNPVYDWKKSSETGHRWWICRMRRSLELFDGVRIDHFRGFESYWEIPAGAPTAREGRWMKGPGYPFFETLGSSLGTLPLVAEDLGILTEPVHSLRKRCGFPGMTVLQFALLDPSFEPSSLNRNTVVYTGTHDNDTTAGWIESTGRAIGYSSPGEIIAMALGSPAVLAVIPIQDVLLLGSSSRMNTPGVSRGNWSFRLDSIPPPADLGRRT